MKPKVGSLERLTKLTNFQLDWPCKTQRKLKLPKKEFKRQLYANKLVKLDKMDKFLEKHTLPNLRRN